VKALTFAEARDTLGSIARDVLHSKRPVIVRTRYGFIKIAPYEGPNRRTAKSSGRLRLLPCELELHNSFGDSL